ncbi:MAG: hypothetical protein LBH43_15345 [Treponema sp.]|jgi:hypothetical protein|nr:hypothetical protein [Treponema sp.]
MYRAIFINLFCGGAAIPRLTRASLSAAGLLVLFFLNLGSQAYADTVAPFVMPSARFAALGGNHTAVGDNFYSLFTNPASFVDVNAQFSASELSISTYGPVLEMLDLYMGSDFENMQFGHLISNAGFAVGFELGGPIALGWVGRGFGFGVFNRISTTASISGTYIRPHLLGDILLVGGYSYRLFDRENHYIDAGILGKIFFRGLIDLKAPVLQYEQIFDDYENSSIGACLGIGVDLGVRYTFRENFAAALVCFDPFSPVLINDTVTVSNLSSPFALVSRRLDFGTRYKLQNDFLDRYISGMVFMADYRDVLSFLQAIPRNPILNIGLGVEIKMLNVLTLRLGIGDALPSVGFGLELSFMIMDFAIRGKELGLDPGIQPVYGFDLGFLFRY